MLKRGIQFERRHGQAGARSRQAVSAPPAHLWRGSARKLAIPQRVTWLPNVFISPEESVELQRTNTQEQMLLFSFPRHVQAPPPPCEREGRAAEGGGEIATVGMQLGVTAGDDGRVTGPPYLTWWLSVGAMVLHVDLAFFS